MQRFIHLSMLVLLAAVAVSSKPSEDLSKESIDAMVEECKTKTEATDEDLKDMMEYEPANSHEGKCLRACVLQKLNAINDEGKINKEIALELIETFSKNDDKKGTIGAEIIDKCVATDVPEDHCDAAEEYFLCIKDHMHESGLSNEDA